MATQNDGGNKKKTARDKPGAKASAEPAAVKKPVRPRRKPGQSTAKSSAGSARKQKAKNSSPTPKSQTAGSGGTAEKAEANGKTGNIADHLWHLVAMTAFMLIADIVLVFLLFPLAVIQLIVVMIDDKPNEEVESVLLVIKAYIIQCLHFMIFRTREMPFPFSPLPKPDRPASRVFSD